MRAFRKITAILVGKLVIIFSRIMGNQGTDFPGRLARRIYPAILQDLAMNIEKDIIVVTGTNGKTTTTNMIAGIIKENQNSYVHNRAGANMITGITTAFIQASNLSGQRRLDYALLETDEANVPLLLRELNPRILLITNFFRDQLDRYGELDHTINLIKDAVTGKDIELLLNADDPLMSHFQDQTGLHSWYYGFNDTNYDILDPAESREGRFCIVCGEELIYDRYHYAQLGNYHCPKCGNHNPAKQFAGGDLTMDPTIHFQINEMFITSPYQGFYNAYNIVAAVSLAKILDISDEIIREAILKVEPRAGRMERFMIARKPVVLILVKNPTGLNQSLSMLLQDPAEKNVFIALNDNAADGRDISWIWDAEVEVLSNENLGLQSFIGSGQRSGDIAVRAKYAGVPLEKIIIEPSLKYGIQLAVDRPSDRSYILCTYTALFECRKILSEMQKSAPHSLMEESNKRLPDSQE